MNPVSTFDEICNMVLQCYRRIYIIQGLYSTLFSRIATSYKSSAMLKYASASFPFVSVKSFALDS